MSGSDGNVSLSRDKDCFHSTVSGGGSGLSVPMALLKRNKSILCGAHTWKKKTY